jgi:hypothetical protein
VFKENNNRYFVGRSATSSEMVFQFLRATEYFDPRDFIHFKKDDKEYYWHCLKKELEFYGILEGHHYQHYVLENKWGSFKWIKNKEQPYMYHGDPRATFSQFFGTSNPFDSENSSANLKRKVSPENDQTFQTIVEIEKRTLDITQKFIEIRNQVENIEIVLCHLPNIQAKDQALKDLEKRSKTCSEAWMKILTDLDLIQLDESQTLVRSKRKSIVNLTNANMDRANEILKQIKNLKEKAFVN